MHEGIDDSSGVPTFAQRLEAAWSDPERTGVWEEYLDTRSSGLAEDTAAARKTLHDGLPADVIHGVNLSVADAARAAAELLINKDSAGHSDAP